VQADGRGAAWPRPALISATSTGTAPTSTAAWLTLVRSIPAFWSMITAPNPIAPAAATRGVQASRRRRLPTSASNGAASTKRATVSHAGPSQPSDSFDSGTVMPHSAPADASAMIAVRWFVFMYR
jgi:hypothetical protein